MVNAPETEAYTFPPFKYADLLDSVKYGDWRDSLVTDGYVVVKEAVPRLKALEYRDKAFAWLESFDLGFDRHRPETWKNEHMPVHIKGGMFHSYGIAHEQWVWDLRTEAGICDAFSKVWGTSKLVTSFDGASVMLPNRTDVTDGGKWQHTDQSPCRRGFYCVQGLVNLNENGPDDGGLMVLKGSSKLFESYFDEMGGRNLRQQDNWGPVDWRGFGDDEIQWFYDKGCQWEKVCAGPGDLILWDSRTIHYNVRPTGKVDRVCSYICMAPAELLSDEDRKIRIDAFKNYRNTTHVPFAAIYSRPHQAVLRSDGQPCAKDTGRPQALPKETLKVQQLVGLAAY